MSKIFKFHCNIKRGSYREIPYQLNGQDGKLRINLCSYLEVPAECINKDVQQTSILFISNKGDCVELLSD